MHINLTVVLRRGQYLHFSLLLESRVSPRGDRCSSFWSVEARTSWSERFLFLGRQKTILDSSNHLVVLFFARISQFFVMTSRIVFLGGYG